MLKKGLSASAVSKLPWIFDDFLQIQSLIFLTGQDVSEIFQRNLHLTEILSLAPAKLYLQRN